MKAAVLVGVMMACSQPPRVTPSTPPPTRTITIIGTSDLHGALERLPVLGGFVANVRAARAADGGGVVLVDAGDLFQGTLESNAAEGADVVRAYNHLGYAASAVGNHEFDYGPVGPHATAQPGEDPRGALKARASEAKFPFVVTNIVDAQTGARIAWPNMPASTMVVVDGVTIGIVGASTMATPTTTMPANFVGLAMAPAAAAIADEARKLRKQGAQLVVLAMHIGSECKDNSEPSDLTTCDHGEELFRVLDALPPGLVDVVVGGHTHAAIAKWIDGMAVIESLSSGRAFGRVDVHMTGSHVDSIAIHPPEITCPLDAKHNPVPIAECHPPPYEGKPVVADAALQRIADEAIAHAGTLRAEKLGVTLATPMLQAYGSESEEGDWFADLMLAAEPTAQVALTNGGGLRAEIPAGDITYGQLFQAMPFDNRFALIAMHGKDLRELVTSNLQHGAGIFSWAGLTARARCKAGVLDVAIEVAGKPLADDAAYTVATSDFLASGGDAGVIGKLHLPDSAIRITDTLVREAMADVLRAHHGTIDPAKVYAPRRMDFEGTRPVHCN